ncbi:paraplegin-like isoform X2 [Physella acuta]|nr:paraplegin-like isoform X2 [Physella acuta]XP_059149698.1 paraplegin-like isoform X2 [Physella acuta]
MDKILYKTLQHNFKYLLKNPSACVKHFSYHQHTISKKCDKSVLSSFTSIHPEYGITQRCIKAKFTKKLKQQITAITAVLMRSQFVPTWTVKSLSHTDFFSDQPSNSDAKNREKDTKNDGHESKKPENEDEDEERKKMEFRRSLYTFISVLFFAWLLTPNSREEASSIKYISWSEFYHNILLKGEVKSIYLYFSSEQGGEDVAIIEVHEGAVIKGQATRGKFVIKIPKGFNFEERIRQVEDELNIPLKDRIPIKYGYPNSWVMLAMQLAVGVVLFFFVRQIFNSFMKGKDGNMMDMMDIFSGGIRQAKFTRVDIASKGSKAVTFKDVAGLKEAKIEVMEFVEYLTDPLRFKNLGAKTPRGALLLGPPGCGKTLLARALASEAKVPFLAMAGSEFVEMIGGVGAARVRNLFKEARNKAPCIIYIDEVDAIGRSRGGSASVGGEDEHTLNQLLVEMDGIETQEGVIVLAATNRADILDKALLRPGRFDRHIMIDLPTLIEREEIFEVYLNKLKIENDAISYAKPLSKLTPGMSGADINNICNEAAIHAAREKRKFVDKKDFEYAVERVLAGVEKKTRLLSPTEKKVVAYHESGHALVGWMLKYTDALLRVSIVPRTNSALGFAQYLPSDQKLYSQEELFERMCMALGGRAAESLIFNHVSTGAHDDLQRVTKMAYDQIRSFGMNSVIGHLSFPSDQENSGQKPYSQKLAHTIDEEARLLIARAFLKTQAVLKENKEKLHLLATALIEKEVLNYEDIEKLIGPPYFGKKNLIEPQKWDGIMPENNNAVKSKLNNS